MSAPAKYHRRAVAPDYSAWLGLGLFGLLALAPFLSGLVYAAHYSVGAAGVLSEASGEGLTWRYWARLFTEPAVPASLGYSLYVALSATTLGVGAALGLVVGFRETWRNHRLGAVPYLSLAVPGTVAAFFVFQLLSGAGFLSRVAYQLGWIAEPGQFPALVSDPYGVGIILTHALMTMPFFLLLFLNLYDSARIAELSRLAQTLGASPGQARRRVATPLLLRRAFPTIVLFGLVTLGSYEVPLLLGQESPQMVSVFIQRKLAGFDLTDRPEAFLAGLVYTLLVVGTLVFVFRSSAAARDF